MIIRLKCNEKPTDESLTIERKLDWINPESDVVWMSHDEIQKDSILVTEDAEVPEEIKAFIPKWREKAIEVDNSRKSFCPIKRAGSEVYYKGGKYYIDTKILYGIGNQYTIDWLFESISRDIEEDMYSIGATYVEYHGMVD